MSNFKQEEIEKIAGGPGSGVSRNNTKEIKNMPHSEHVSVGTRKGILKNMPFTEEVIEISKITHVGQSKFVPSKLNKMIKNWKFLKDKPIEVLKVGDEYHVIDGHHRYLAAKELREKTIKANVYVKREEKTAGRNELGDAIKDHFKPITDKWSERLNNLKDRKGDFELDLSGFSGDGFQKTWEFLEEVKKHSTENIGCIVDEEKSFDWKGCEIITDYIKPRMSNHRPEDIHILIKGGPKEISIMKEIFEEISKINSGTGGSFTVNGKKNNQLDGDGADRVASKIKDDLPKNKVASITNLFDKYRNENKVKTSDFDTLLHNFKNNILIDLDNVIHDMDKYDDNKIDGKPVEGAKEWIDKLRDTGKHIYILSARSCRNFDSKKELIENWLDKYGIYYDEVVDKKVPASVFIDDRAIAFHGSWEDAYNEAVNFKPFQNQGKDRILKHTKYLDLKMKVNPEKGVDGYIYAHEASCSGKKIAILPYRRLYKEGYEVLLREEITPAWGMKPVLSSITGSMDNPDESPIEAARRELMEETGFYVEAKDIEELGTCFGSKAMDTVYYLFSVDVTGKKPRKIKGDGTKLEFMAENRFVKNIEDKVWVFDSYKTKDPIAAMLISRKGGFSDYETDSDGDECESYNIFGTDKKSKIHKKKLLEELSEMVHEQWMDLAKGVIATEPNLSEKRKRRWSKYFVDYDKLDEFNKEKDRSWGRKYLKILEKKGSWIEHFGDEELKNFRW